MASKTRNNNPSEPAHALVPTQSAPAPSSLARAEVPEAARAFMEEAKQPAEAPAKLPLVSIDHKNGGFILPTGEVVPEISGYPIYYFMTRRYYKRPPQPGQKGMPPDCWSADLIEPHDSSTEKQAEMCSKCPMSQFNTGRDGRSQACGTYTWLFLLNPDFGPPPLAVVVAPPSSLRPIFGTRFSAGYLAQAKAKYGAYQVAWTTLRLKQQGDQVVYCTLDPVMGPACNMDVARELANYFNKFKAAMEGYRMKTPDVQGGGEE